MEQQSPAREALERQQKYEEEILALLIAIQLQLGKIVKMIEDRLHDGSAAPW